MSTRLNGAPTLSPIPNSPEHGLTERLVLERLGLDGETFASGGDFAAARDWLARTRDRDSARAEIASSENDSRSVTDAELSLEEARLLFRNGAFETALEITLAVLSSVDTAGDVRLALLELGAHAARLLGANRVSRKLVTEGRSKIGEHPDAGEWKVRFDLRDLEIELALSAAAMKRARSGNAVGPDVESDVESDANGDGVGEKLLAFIDASVGMECPAIGRLSDAVRLVSEYKSARALDAGAEERAMELFRDLLPAPASAPVGPMVVRDADAEAVTDAATDGIVPRAAPLPCTSLFILPLLARVDGPGERAKSVGISVTEIDFLQALGARTSLDKCEAFTILFGIRTFYPSIHDAALRKRLQRLREATGLRIRSRRSVLTIESSSALLDWTNLG